MEMCERHDPWASDALLVMNWEDGTGMIGGVRINEPRECRRCGHICTADELFYAFTGELREIAEKRLGGL